MIKICVKLWHYVHCLYHVTPQTDSLVRILRQNYHKKRFERDHSAHVSALTQIFFVSLLKICDICTVNNKRTPAIFLMSKKHLVKMNLLKNLKRETPSFLLEGP